MGKLIIALTLLLISCQTMEIKEINLRRRESIETRFEREHFFKLFSKYSSLESFLKSRNHKANFLSNYTSKIKKYYSEFKRMKQKFNKSTEIPSENVLNFWEASFYGEIEVGTPPQKINVILDSGSSDLWLALPDCDGCNDSITFNPSQSSTFTSSGLTDQTSLGYGSGSATGTVSYDVVNFGGLIATNFQFVAVSSATGFDATYDPANGLLGLAFPSLSSQSPQAPNIIQTLQSNNQIPQAVFSLYLSPNDNEAGSKLFIGGYNSDYFQGEINYIPLSSATYYQINYEGFECNGQTFADESGSTFLDSGTTLIQVPSNVVSGLSSIIGDVTKDCNNIKNLNLPVVNVLINGESYPLTAFDYVFYSERFNDCKFAFTDTFYLGMGVLGDQFIKAYYTVFDLQNQRVGLAKAKNNN